MKPLVHLALGAGLLSALVAGGGYACSIWNARVGLSLTEWLDVQRQLGEERRREAILDYQKRWISQQLQAKSQVLEELRDHRLTLLEAAARFRDLDSRAAGSYLEWSRLHEPGQTDEERWCRQVIRFLRGHSAEMASLADQFEAQLTNHLAQGSLHLPG